MGRVVMGMRSHTFFYPIENMGSTGSVHSCNIFPSAVSVNLSVLFWRQRNDEAENEG